MHCIKSNFDKMMHVLKEILGNDIPISGTFVKPGPKPKFSDIEVVALSLTAECLGIDSELFLFHKLNSDYKNEFPNLISRRQYNDRRKFLFNFMEYARKKMADQMNQINEVYAIDSMPLEICKLSRMNRSNFAKDHEYAAPARGFCASQDKYVFGYKLHALCSPSGVIQSFDLSPANIHDIHYLKDVGNFIKDAIVTGDRGYINKKIKKILFNRSGIVLETPSRSNQKIKSHVIKPLRVIRKRIETVFSQLCGQFMIQRNYAKQWMGYKTRILSKITAMTILQYINKYIRKKPVGQIKYALNYL